MQVEQIAETESADDLRIVQPDEVLFRILGSLSQKGIRRLVLTDDSAAFCLGMVDAFTFIQQEGSSLGVRVDGQLIDLCIGARQALNQAIASGRCTRDARTLIHLVATPANLEESVLELKFWDEVSSIFTKTYLAVLFSDDHSVFCIQ